MPQFAAVNFERGWATVFCTAQFFLPGGNVAAESFLRFTDGPQKFTVPVTGGTGAYFNASGSIAIRDIGAGKSALIFQSRTSSPDHSRRAAFGRPWGECTRGPVFADVNRRERVEASWRLKPFGASRNGSYPWAGRS